MESAISLSAFRVNHFVQARRFRMSFSSSFSDRALSHVCALGDNSLVIIIWAGNGNGPPLVQKFNAIPEAEGKGDIPPYKSSGICYNPKDLQPPRHRGGTRDSFAPALQF